MNQTPEYAFLRRSDVPANDNHKGENKFFSVEFIHHVERMIRFLTSLMRVDVSAYTPRDISLRLERMQEAADSELYEWVMGGDEGSWKTHPSFYHALLKELTKRQILG